MADISMCTNKECEFAATCYRLNAAVDPYRQSYLVDPKRECENNKFKYYIEVKTNRGK